MQQLSEGWSRSENIYGVDFAKTLQQYVVKVDELLSSHHRQQLKLWEEEQNAILERTHMLDEASE